MSNEIWKPIDGYDHPYKVSIQFKQDMSVPNVGRMVIQIGTTAQTVVQRTEGWYKDGNL